MTKNNKVYAILTNQYYKKIKFTVDLDLIEHAV